MKKFNLIYLFIAFAGLQSCTSDMDVVSEDPRVLSDDILYATPAGYKQALAGVYGNLSLTGTGDAGSSFLEGIDAGTSHFARCMWYLQCLTTDEMIWSYEGDAGTAELQRNTWNSNNPILIGMYSRTMVEVAFVNEFLRKPYDQITSSDGINIFDGINIPDSDNTTTNTTTNITTDISVHSSDKGLFHHSRKQLFTILNIIEDLYIDAFSYMKAPGYRGYYKSLYQKYFGDDKIVRGFYDKKFHKPTLTNYFYHICNIRNPYRNLRALPSLEEIWNLLDIKNIKRLTTQQDRLDVTIKVLNLCTLPTPGLSIVPSTLVDGYSPARVVLSCKLVNSVVSLETAATPGFLITPDSTVPGVSVDAVVLDCRLDNSVVNLEIDPTPGARARPITSVSAMVLCFSQKE